MLIRAGQKTVALEAGAYRIDMPTDGFGSPGPGFYRVTYLEPISQFR
jgi:hypothetical protein